MMRPQDSPTYVSLVLRALARHPDRTAFRADDAAINYRQALHFIGAAQAVFAARGLGPQHRLAILSANRWETWAASIAAQALGAIVTSLHPLGSLDTHLFQIDDAGVTMLLVDVEGFSTRGVELAAARPQLRVLAAGSSSDFDDLLAAVAAQGSTSPRDLSGSQEIATLNYTGGTTGIPKGVVKTSAANAFMAMCVLAEFELPHRPSFLAVAPISHVAGTNVLPVLWRGGTVHLLRKFDPAQVCSTIERERISFTLMVPSMIYMLLDDASLAQHDLGSLELLLYGASPMLPTRLAEALERIGPVFSQLYGQSECYPVAALPREDHDATRPHLLAACGFPAAGCEVVLLDDDGQPVADGEDGEICVRGRHVMRDYWQQPELTAQTLRDGFLHTGDVARRDEEGRLYIVDRKKDMVISGGFNVYPREVEDALGAHPAVAQVAVIGTPDPRWGEAVKAVVVLREGLSVQAEELQDFVRERKGSLMAPKQVVFVDALPVTPVGKVDKQALRRQDRDAASTS